MLRVVVLVILVGVSLGVSIHGNGRIVGGQEAAPAQFPYQVSLRNLAADGVHFCMGVILNQRWVATTVRCTFWRMPVENIAVVAGSNRLSSGGTTYRAIHVVEHPEYRQEGFMTYENDISLIQVDRNIVFSATIASIPISSNFIGGGVNVDIAGFGTRSAEETVHHDAMLYFRSTTLTNADSQNRFPEFMDGEITERTFCTFLGNGQGVCRGLAGAGVVANNAAVGVMSFGNVGGTCGVFPDCHTRLSSFRSWILSVIE
ncbi:CLUMA_CG016530, isoform A [Clunio marinus]|uniref:CLUMA_CG016530, isoform A n=1 Tax=Clunio marinus TaxID=568069 RepID=A0A1J1IUA8_9DIPT|nr:CLUMA_CG016530, isoform A [Clunio marinus]